MPSLLAVLTPADLGGVGRLVVGAEAITAEQVEVWAAGRVLVNTYGPTEATVMVTATGPLRCNTATAAGAGAGEGQGQVGGPVPMGGPVANTRVHVLDGWLNPVPVGVTGEVYLGGDSLGRGYLNRPGLTAARFVADRFAPGPGGRLYRSGDLARWTRGGELVFAGRADQQVKIRGHRVEPGEVQAVLGAHPAVKQAAVLTQPGTHSRADTDRLPRPPPTTTPTTADQASGRAVMAMAGEELISEVRSYLAGRLPDYMIPAAFLVLTALPLNINGKLDHAALPAPTSERSDPRAPANAT